MAFVSGERWATRTHPVDGAACAADGTATRAAATAVAASRERIRDLIMAAAVPIGAADGPGSGSAVSRSFGGLGRSDRPERALLSG
ncbi:hypothetical protein GCM10009869_05900 [Amnibacterium kyonggiense]